MLRTFYLFGVILIVAGAPKERNLTPIRQLTTVQTIIADGYAGESYNVTTVDGYILGLHRIPYGRGQSSGDPNRPVIFMMHGLTSSSRAFILRGPEFGVAYNLADAGFDVWLGDSRGNTFSRNHVTLNPDDPAERLEFFDFSWEEIGSLDIPAMIDYILEHTGQEKLHYIGHSQGGTTFLVLGSLRPEYNEKFASVHLLAGVGFMNYFPDQMLVTVARLTDIIYSLAVSRGLVEITPDLQDTLPFPTGYTRADLCFGDIKYKPMCDLIGAKHFIRNDEITDFDYGFGGGSLKQVAHYGQNLRDRSFRRYNYGSARNLELYGTSDPPIFDLGLIVSNVTMHYSLSDELLDERDVLDMAANMPNCRARRVSRDTFNHGDFIGADDARELVTDYIIQDIITVHEAAIAAGEDGDSSGDNGQDTNPVEPVDPVDPVDSPTTGAATNVSLNIMFKMYLVVCVIYSMF